MRVPALETEHLSRAVWGKVLTDAISVQVQTGEVLAVVGPSGSGKSSFLRLLNRLDEPTGGTVRLDGQDYRALAPEELRRRAGMVMQTAYLFPGTVAANERNSPSHSARPPSGSACSSFSMSWASKVGLNARVPPLITRVSASSLPKKSRYFS